MSASPSDTPQSGASAALLNNRYRLLATVAAGGMATVYKAQDVMLNRLVAVKVLRDRYSHDPQFVHRFREEAAAAANLNHPNVVTIFDVGSDVLSGQERHYIVMELIDGEDLKQHMRQRQMAGGYEVEAAVQLMRQVSEGVAYAHKRGLVHCDLKPQNVLVTADGRAKVTDFGIARAYTMAVNPNAREDVVWGTPQYYAPEQAAGVTPTPASDVYSLGVMLYELLAGRLPFTASDTATLARLHQTAAPPSLSAINPNVSLQLENVVTRALVKDPAQRYRNADQLAATLTAYLQQGEENTLLGMAPVAPPRAAPSAQPRSQPQSQPAASAPSIEQRIKARQGEPARAAPAPVRPPMPRVDVDTNSVGASAYTRGGTPKREGVDLMLVLLGIVAVLCVLGLVPLYATVYAEYTRPPAPAAPTPDTPQPQPQNPQQGAAVADAPSPQVTASQSPGITVTVTPTPTFDLPTNLVGSVLNDNIKTLFASQGVTLVVTDTYSLDPENTILAVEPNVTRLEVSSTLTLTVSSGGRVDLNTVLGSVVVVESARFDRDEFAPGMTLKFDVTWRAARAVGKDYRVFVHLFDPAGNFIGQTGDRAPANNGAPFPTAGWSAGTVVVDTYTMQIPLDALPGRYEIRVGLYDDAGRLQVTEPGRAAVKNSGVVVRTVRVR
jgi:eukaryotic-like serine/threonine-protein kinase